MVAGRGKEALDFLCGPVDLAVQSVVRRIEGPPAAVFLRCVSTHT